MTEKDGLQELAVKQAYNDYKNVVDSKDKQVYLRNNAGFDYSKYVSNELDPEKLGIKKEPYFDVFVDNVFKLPKYIDKMLNHRIPGGEARAGETDLTEKDRNYSVEVEDNKFMTLRDIKNKYKQYEKSTPYKNFEKDMKKAIGANSKKDTSNVDNKKEKTPIRNLNGLYASSYFIKLGDCPIRMGKEKCVSSGYNYREEGEGSCWKPRYGFVKNKGGSAFGDGIIFSILKSIMDLNPLEIIVIMMTGNSAGGSFIAPTCDDLTKHEDDKLARFIVNKHQEKYYAFFIIGCLVLILILIHYV